MREPFLELASALGRHKVRFQSPCQHFQVPCLDERGQGRAAVTAPVRPQGMTRASLQGDCVMDGLTATRSVPDLEAPALARETGDGLAAHAPFDQVPLVRLRSPGLGAFFAWAAPIAAAIATAIA
jgi:hypothetical protein